MMRTSFVGYVIAVGCAGASASAHRHSANATTSFFIASALDRTSRKPRELAAVDTPEAVRLTLHRVERDPGGALAIDHSDRLHHFALDHDSFVELGAAGPINHSVFGPNHGHERLSRTEAGADTI